MRVRIYLGSPSAKREAAWESFQPKFKEDPELLEIAEGYKKYIASRT